MRWSAAFALLALAAPTLAQRRTGPVTVPQSGVHIQVDGVLGEDEWAGATEVALNDASQLAHTEGTPWGGVNDLSATLYLCYDPAHLYIAGRVLDNEVVRERHGEWHAGDAIELFFGAAAPPGTPTAGADDSAYRFGESELQLFLMPLNPVRRWGAVSYPERKYGGSNLTGVQVAHVEHPGKGYDFEAVIPFHVLPQLEPGAPGLGFNVALDDRDGQSRYLYMTMTGTNPVDDRRQLRRLRFVGPGPLASVGGEGVDLYEQVREIGPFVLVPLLVVLIGALLLRAWGYLVRRHPFLRLVGQASAALLLVLGLFLPGWLAKLRSYNNQRRADTVVQVLRDKLPAMEKGTLGSYRGGERDAPFIDLVSGKTVPRKQIVTYEGLVDLARGGFGEGPKRYPVDGFPILPYWIPLPRDQAEQLTFRQPLEGTLNVVFSLPAFRADEPDARVKMAMRYAGTDAESSESRTVSLEELPLADASVLGPVDRDLMFVSLELSQPLSALALTSLGSQGLQLVGLTLLSGEDEEGQALYLGQASLGGVETDLRGRYPEEAGLLLERGVTKQVEIAPDRAKPFDRVWLFYRADFPGTDRPLPFSGEKVAEVVLHFKKGGPAPMTIAFQHQKSMFFELASKNQASEPDDEHASVAYRWVEGEDESREQFINLGYSVDLPAGAVVTSLEFRNFNSYAIRFRSVVFRESKPMVRVEPEDSPLEVTDTNKEVRLGESVLSTLRGVSLAIYRNGTRQAVTEGGEQVAPATLPRGLLRRLRPDQLYGRGAEVQDTQVYEDYVPLSGEGWSGAVLGVFAADSGYGGHVRNLHRIGVLLCLMAAPILLLLFGEALAVLNNLRLRLMAVLCVTTLVPLAILSLVLVRVLESGHEGRLRGDMQQAVAAAAGRLAEQKAELLASAKKWLDPLVAEIRNSAPRPGDAERQIQLEAALKATMESQKPPDWNGGFLRLELSGQQAGSGVTAFVGDRTLQAAETPLRKEPGVYLSWGIPFLGVRWETEIEGIGLCSLSVARPLDHGLLGGLAPGRGVILCDTKGYPLTAVEGTQVKRELLTESGMQPAMMAERRRALAAALETGQPAFARHHAGGRSWMACYDVLRDPEENPRALLGIVDVDQEAVLPLDLGPVPVRTYFLAVGSLLLLLSGFLSFVVTARITKPIERLERGAQALSRGEFDVRVETEEGGQIGRLTRTFNRMARDLRARIQDLHHLNRGIQDLTSRLDLKETVTSAIGFCARHSPADRVGVLLREPERSRIEVFGGRVPELDAKAPDVEVLLGASGPLTMRLAGAGTRCEALSACFPEHRSLVALPLVLAGRNRGAVLLLFESDAPAQIHLELLSTMAAQTAAAVENARLYLHAVEDLYTGAFVPDFFRRRVVHAVQEAQEQERPLALLGIGLVESRRLSGSLGAERFGRLMEKIATVLRGALPDGAMLCRSADDAFQALVDGADKDAAERHLAVAVAALESAELDLPAGTVRLRLHGATAVFPAEAASAEFLFHAVESQRSPADTPPLRQRMRALQGEGLVFLSPATQRVFRTLERVAPTDLTVLLEGETGTGKEVLTDLIHRWSKRARGPLVKVHCAALSESLLQSELFGHEKGAFTGAVARKIGKFEQAQGGTIFLDEIGEVSMDTQVKLLRVLQEREIDRVGGLQPVPVDVRVIAATNRNIREMVAQGAFREDLYYRLQGMVVTVPPLRERKQEIPDLVERFRQEAAAAGHTTVKGFHPDAMDELFKRDWPGNVRELRNTVFRAMVLASGDLVRPRDLLGVLPEGPVSEPPASPTATAPPIDESAAAPASVVPRPEPGRGGVSDGRGPEGRLAVLLELVRERGSISTADYVEVARVSRRTGLRDFAELQRRGLIERVGKRRGARYRLPVA